MTALVGGRGQVHALPRRPARPTALGERGSWLPYRQLPASDAARSSSPARPPGSSFKGSLSGKQRRRPGRSGFQRGAAKCRRPTGGSPADGGVERSWRWASPQGVHPAGEANTLPEKGDKVLAHPSRRRASPATPVAGDSEEGRLKSATGSQLPRQPIRRKRKRKSLSLNILLSSYSSSL